MKTKVYLAIFIRIVFIFSIWMLMTYIPDHLREFFGDMKLEECENMGPDPCWEWGIRHYLYFWMMILLSILTLVNLFWTCVNIINKNYDL